MKRFILLVLAVVTLVTSCQPAMTLQRYFLESQENTDFTLIEIPASLLGGSLEDLTPEQMATFNSLRKVSVLMYRNAEKKEFIASQQSLINSFLKSDGFEALVSARTKGEAQASILIRGEVDQIDEAVFFGFAEGEGFVLARILGEQMNPAAFLQLADSLKESDFQFLSESVLKDILGEEEL
jgi:hypothetical protein